MESAGLESTSKRDSEHLGQEEDYDNKVGEPCSGSGSGSGSGGHKKQKLDEVLVSGTGENQTAESNITQGEEASSSNENQAPESTLAQTEESSGTPVINVSSSSIKVDPDIRESSKQTLSQDGNEHGPKAVSSESSKQVNEPDEMHTISDMAAGASRNDNKPSIIVTEKQSDEDTKGDSVEMETEENQVGGAGGLAIDEDAEKERRPVRKNSQVLVGLKETDVGILEYLSNHKGIGGVIKQRYRDFLVNEISEDGTIVHLTDTTCPKKKSILHFDAGEVLTEADREELLAINKGLDKKAEYLIPVTDDKELRTKVHQAIKHLYPKLDSSTVEVGGQRMVKVTKGGGGGGNRGRSRWPKDVPSYCSFVLYKENMDVNEALNLIAKYLHIGPHHMQYAGSKDKRGVTVQRVTVHRIDGERLSQLNKVLRCIRLGNFRYVDKPLNLGELSGNHFNIVLRLVEATKDEVDAAMTSLRERGFINYFGMQRFGNSLVATYFVGRALLLGQWQTAVDLILKPREGAQDDNRWREHWMKTRDPKTTLAMLPQHKKKSAEQQLLWGLHKSGNNYVASFSSIPRNTRLMYLHSYQSYVWNMITTRRLQTEGMAPVIGDLVSKQDDDLGQPSVEYVTAENQKEYSIYDVVLPLPGHGVKYPSHQAGQWYTDILSKDGITAEMLKNPNRDLSLSGAYRKCVVKPNDVEWSLHSYDDEKIPLVPTDLEKLENASCQSPQTEGQLTAVKVEFSLPSSCYATMALREVMKIDTSAVHQSTLNK